MFMLKARDPCVFSASSYPFSSLVLRQELQSRLNATLLEAGHGRALRYVIQAGGVEYNATTRLLYCDYRTYTLTMACRGEQPELMSIQNFSCDYQPAEAVPKLGLFPIPGTTIPA